MQIKIRPAQIKDLPSILSIVNHNILHTTAVYDYTPRAVADMEAWFTEKQQGSWPVIVSEQQDVVTGYATYGTFRIKAAYQFTVEHSVYVSHDYTGKGTGKLLLAELIQLAKGQDFHTMIGCIDADNASSIAFHRNFGFTDSGILKEVGYKFDRWLDLQLMQLILQ